MEKNVPRTLFISWAHDCSRSDNIARELGGNSYMIYFASLGSNYLTVWLKYFLQTIKSLQILLKERPDVVFVMSPPIIACVPVYLYCLFRGKQYVIDAHTATFLHPRWKDKQRLNRFFISRALRTIVTNEYLGKSVKELGGKYFLISDVPVRFPSGDKMMPVANRNKHERHKAVITMINTFSPDEPFENFIEAASRFNDIEFFITGDISYADRDTIKNVKKNITFTGFVPSQDFGNLLKDSDFVCVFTTRDHTMLRGAYEAIYLGKPVIISNWNILKEKFTQGAIHVDNTVDGMAEGIRQALTNKEDLAAGAKRMRNMKMSEWSSARADLMKILNATTKLS